MDNGIIYISPHQSQLSQIVNSLSGLLIFSLGSYRLFNQTAVTLNRALASSPKVIHFRVFSDKKMLKQVQHDESVMDRSSIRKYF